MNIHQILISDFSLSEIELPKSIESIDKNFTDFEYTIWDIHMIRDFIANNFNYEVLNAFETLKPYAYKADLASYCILSKIGGLFSAITNEFVLQSPDFKGKDLFIFRDIQKYTSTSWAVHNGLIYAKKNNPVFDVAIGKVVRNVMNKNYGYTCLCVTGPNLFGQSIAEIGDIKSYSIGDFEEGNPKVFRLENGQVLANYKNLSGGDTGIKGTNNYGAMWNSKNVYGER